VTDTTDLSVHLAAWRAQDPDPDTVAQLDRLMADAEAGDDAAAAELASAFAGPLTFGTAGLRGPLGAGPGRMNRVVVTQAAAGFARWLQANGHGGGRVVIGYDARHKSADFARDTAEIFAGAGFEPILTGEPTPTPVVAYGIQHFGCVAGVVVTASHNPPQDNGYKVYLGDGSQIVPPTDDQIATEIAAVARQSIGELPRSTAYRILGDELVAAYVADAAALIPADAPRDVAWVYTAMHGVGARVLERVARAAGFPDPIVVPEQHDPDPDFPTVAFPNPEEKGAIDLAVALAKREHVDVVVANDPDADRCAAAAVVGDDWRMLTGDELGAVLGHDAIERGVTGVFACSVVSSTLLQRMAQAAGRPYETTLTGFKWIGRVKGLGFGYEEAIGYCCNPESVPDKDGITAALLLLALVARLKAAGRTVADLLDDIARTYGLHSTAQLSVRVADLSLIADAMARLRGNPPSTLLDEPVTVTDLAVGSAALPPTDAIDLSGPTLHVVARPSGTEPKLKCYLEVRATPEESTDVPAARAYAAARLVRLRAEMAEALGVEA
jgi:phosphomannomutase